jgi:hypothetical protein
MPLPPANPLALIRTFLTHYGYASTLKALAPGSGPPGSDHNPGLTERGRIRGLIMKGDVDAAEALLRWVAKGRRSWLTIHARCGYKHSTPNYPARPRPHHRESHVGKLMDGESGARVRFALACQKFVELIRARRVAEAIEVRT